MSKDSRKMKFWTKGFILSFSFLILSVLIVVLLTINRIFVPIPWFDLLYELIRPYLLLIFYNYNLYIYGGIFISYSLLLLLYVLGYNLTKVKQMTGSIIYVFSLLGFVLVTFIAVHFTYASVLFNQDLSLNVRLMLLLLFLLIIFAFSLFLTLVNTDFLIFFKDLIKARKS